MLVLTRRIGERVVISSTVHVVVLEATPVKVRLGIEAPKEIAVHRAEVLLRIRREENERQRRIMGT